MGVNGNIFKVIYNLYKHAKSYVQVAGECSDFFPCQVGVRQGENLSPILFAMYLNDLSDFLRTRVNGLESFRVFAAETYGHDFEVFIKLFLLLYADDTVLLCETADDLQRSLDAVNDYCEKWDLKINVSKSKVMIFSRGKVRLHPDFTLCNTTLEVVQEYKYLGVIFNYNGKFGKSVNYQVQKASRAMFALLRKQNELGLDISTMFFLFDTCVLPIALYGCEVWGFDNLSAIEKLHLKFCKIILKLKSSTSNAMIYGETGRLPIKCTVLQRMVCFWYNLCTCKSIKLSSFVYGVVYFNFCLNSNVDECSWLRCIYSVLCCNGLNNIWQQQCVNISYVWLKSKIKLSLSDTFMQNWWTDVVTMSKCSNYRYFKTNFSYENYLDVLPNDLKIAVCRFRCRNSKVPVESKHYILDGNSFCKLCSSNEIGDEFHYLFNCKYFDHDRKKCMPKYFYCYPHVAKMETLFNLKHPHLQKLAKFIKIIVNSL